MLTDVTIRAAKPRQKPYKMGDALGLFLLIQPNGGKWWRFKYRVNGKEKLLAIGTYPQTSLVEARRLRDAARDLLAAGKDPSLEKQRAKAQGAVAAKNSFAVVAAEFCDKRTRDGIRSWAPATQKKNAFLLALLNPSLGALPVTEIVPHDVLTAVRKIESRGKRETARRALQFAGCVFRYAVATARLGSDPTRDLKGALLAPIVRSHPAIIEPVRVGALLRAIEGYDGQILTRLALQLMAHVFVRPGELRQSRWEQFDLEGAVWTIPASTTKMRKVHNVPLSKQSLNLLNQVQETTGRTEGYVFPGMRSVSRPLSENTLNGALRRLGYSQDEMTAHGFRTTGSTLLNESGKWSADAIERALSHADEDKVRGTYHRGEHWAERVAMAQWWSDYLDTLKNGGEVVHLPLVDKK